MSKELTREKVQELCDALLLNGNTVKADMFRHHDAAQRATVELYKNEMDRCLDQLAELSGLPRTEVGYEPAINKLRATIQQLEARLRESEEISSWYGSLVKRANIGTKETPSLKAYIEQMEQLNKGLEKELEMYRSIAEREGAEIAVSQLSQEQAKVKQLEARVKILEKQLNERPEDGTKILSKS